MTFFMDLVMLALDRKHVIAKRVSFILGGVFTNLTFTLYAIVLRVAWEHLLRSSANGDGGSALMCKTRALNHSMIAGSGDAFRCAPTDGIDGLSSGAIIGHPYIATPEATPASLIAEVLFTFALCHVVIHTATTSFGMTWRPSALSATSR